MYTSVVLRPPVHIGYAFLCKRIQSDVFFTYRQHYNDRERSSRSREDTFENENLSYSCGQRKRRHSKTLALFSMFCHCVSAFSRVLVLWTGKNAARTVNISVDGIGIFSKCISVNGAKAE